MEDKLYSVDEDKSFDLRWYEAKIELAFLKADLAYLKIATIPIIEEEATNGR